MTKPRIAVQTASRLRLTKLLFPSNISWMTTAVWFTGSTAHLTPNHWHTLTSSLSQFVEISLRSHSFEYNQKRKANVNERQYDSQSSNNNRRWHR